MKESKVKLSLNRMTVSHLNGLEMNRLNGGIVSTEPAGFPYPDQPVCEPVSDGCLVSNACNPNDSGKFNCPSFNAAITCETCPPTNPVQCV